MSLTRDLLILWEVIVILSEEGSREWGGMDFYLADRMQVYFLILTLPSTYISV
jgi:hypothetical protein